MKLLKKMILMTKCLILMFIIILHVAAPASAEKLSLEESYEKNFSNLKEDTYPTESVVNEQAFDTNYQESPFNLSKEIEIDEEEQVDNSIEHEKSDEIEEGKALEESNETEPTEKVEIGENLESEIQNEESDVNENTDTESEPKVPEKVSDSTEKIQNDLESIPDSEDEKSTESLEGKEFNQSQSENSSVSPMSVINASLFNNGQLSADYVMTDGQYAITLEFSANGLLNLSLLQQTRIVYQVPAAFAGKITGMSGTYDVPALGLFGIVIPNRGSFSQNQINYDEAIHSIYMDFRQLLSLGLLSSYTYRFTLTMHLDSLPVVQDGVYNFRSTATSGLIDLSLNSGHMGEASLQVEYPEVPALSFDEPIFSTDTVIRGNGTAGLIARITIENQIVETAVSSDGTFELIIDNVQPGTVITGVQVRENSLISEEVSTIVQRRPDPPTLEDIYPQDTIVTGSAEPNTTVQLIIDNQVYSGDVSNDGTFSIDIQSTREAGTEVTAIVINESQHSSTPIIVHVREGTLSILFVPESLPFESQSLTNDIRTVNREDPDWTIAIEDTRALGSQWILAAHINQPLSGISDPAHNLPNALIFVDEQQQIIPFSTESIRVFTGETQSTEPTEVRWSYHEGPLIYLESLELRADTYTTTITWTLYDAP